MVYIVITKQSCQRVEGRILRRFIVSAILEVGVVYPAPQNEILAVDAGQVGRHLQEVIIRLIGIFVGQGGFTA